MKGFSPTHQCLAISSHRLGPFLSLTVTQAPLAQGLSKLLSSLP